METSLRQAGYQVQVISDLAELAAVTGNATEGSVIRAVIAVGGDGTAACVRRLVPLHIPMLPVPMGTENLLARYLGQAATAAAVRSTVERGVVIGLDLGRANGQPFLMMISAGFDAEVIRRLHENRRGNITRGSYLKPILQAIRSYSYPLMRIYLGQDGSAAAGPSDCRWLFGFNLPLYALGWCVAPQADGTDGELDVCLLERGSLASGCRYWWHVVRGSHRKLADVHESRCRRFRVEAAGGAEVAYQLDGDYGGMLPADVEIAPGELRLLVSRKAATRLGFAISGQPLT
jgi:diacylglycerol kinase family enzyme